MKRVNKSWTIQELLHQAPLIEFPEYQREPNVWQPLKRSLLIDSLYRGLDISSIIFFEREDGRYDCIDGRQRLTTIFTFFGIVHSSTEGLQKDLKFKYERQNEVYNESLPNGCKEFLVDPQDMQQSQLLLDEGPSTCLEQYRDKIKDVSVSIVIVDSVDHKQELNLMFARLQLAQPLNAGEKLHAMVGWMKEQVFNRISPMTYFSQLGVPYRRYAKEQVAAQILLQAISLRKKKDFSRARFQDLQGFILAYQKEDKELSSHVSEAEKLLKELAIASREKGLRIGNRATAVSFFCFFFRRIDETEYAKFASMLKEIDLCIKWQNSRGDVREQWDVEYSLLVEFRVNLTQAAVEPYAIKGRDGVLERLFHEYRLSGRLIGDDEWQSKHQGKSPEEERAALLRE